MQYHLLKENGEWHLREQGSREALFSTGTKSEAMEMLGEYMDSRDGSVAVHKVNGRIQERRSYSSDSDSLLASTLNVTKWSVIGVVTVAALTAAGVAWYFRDSIPTDKLRLPK